jgi:DNA-binding SARP family transcriptional activator
MADPAVLLELTAVPRARLAGRAVDLLPHDALLLAWLALEGPTPRERLAALLWPDSSAEAARNALRQRLFRLRRLLGQDAVAGSTQLALADGVQHDLAGATALLGSLAASGLPELDAWLAGRRSTHQAQARQALEQRIEALEAAGDAATALPLAQQLLEADPLSEDSHRRVMRLHYLRGDRAAAVLAFDRCEQVLKHEIGAAPSRATLALLATIESSDAPIGAARQPPPAAVLRPPRLVGRAAELALLRQGLASGHVVVLLGEAGMGKSRLLQALAAGQAGVVHVSGRPGDSLVPYATLARALRHLLDLDPGVADPALRRALAPLLPEWLPPDATVRALQPPLAQPVLALLQRLARHVDTLALDDLHFADDATLELLQTLLAAPREGAAESAAEGPHPGQARLRWCLGLRPAPAASRLQGLLDALATAGPHTRLALRPLSVAQVAELVDSLGLPGFSGASVAAVAEALHQRSGGNPLFALETLKLAWNDGTLARAGELPRPASLAQLIGQQLARLSPPALQLARVAAVAGVDFSLPLATSLLGRNALELADAWAELEAQQVLRGDAFAHDLIHDAVLQGLPEIIARHLHGQTAARLEALDGEAARIAAHWEAAGQRARALPALRRAAERAHRALREGERIAFLLRAADIAEAAGRGGEAFELVRGALEAHMNIIRQADGLPLLDRLQALATTPLQLARVAGDRAWYATVLGDFDAALEFGAQALHQALPLGDAGLVATIRQRLGTMLGMVGRFEQALPHMRAAEPWIEHHAAPEAVSEFQGNLAVVLDNLGRPAQAQPHHLRALALSAAQGDHAQRATQLANYAASRLDAGDLAGAGEQAAQAQLIVSTYEMAGSSAGFIAVLKAQCERALGHHSAALQWCARAEAILAERNPSRLPVARLHRAHVWLDLGQHARALQDLGGAALDSARTLPPRYAVRWLVLLARVQRRLRQDGAALLAEALALTPDEGWPELRLIVGIEQALALDAAAALAHLHDVAAQAQAHRLHGAELAALLHATALAARHDRSAAPALAQRALALADVAEALHADRALRWLAPAQALADADPAQSAALLRAGREWLRTTAAAHVAPEFGDSYLHQHPLNAALLSWQPAR